MQLALTGHSKFKVELSRFDNRDVVIKSAPTGELYKRLKSQMSKQVTSTIFYDKFQTPELIVELASNRAFVMEYLDFLAPCDYLCMTSPSDCSWFYAKVLHYIEHIFKYSVKAPFDGMIFDEKVADVAMKVSCNPVIETVFKGRERINSLTMSLLKMSDTFRGKNDFHGWCHGDFTLSNLLIDRVNKKVAWLDFLDGWDHSPYIDIAKIAQETRYKWSMRFRPDGCSKARKQIYGSRLSDMLRLIKGELPGGYDSELAKIYILLNDFRLLQYETDRHWFELILGNIERIKA